MASNSFKFVFLFILVSFFNLQTIEAQDLQDLDRSCPEIITTTNSTTYQVNVKTLFSSLASKTTVNTFYNNTVGGAGNSTSNAAYGLFMCRGDVPSQLCGECVRDATHKLSSACYSSAWAIIWYDECMVRYSNSSFFSTMETYPGYYMCNIANVSNQESFMPLFADTMNKTADEAASSTNSDKYATKEASVSQNQTLYCLAQCTKDLSAEDCERCLGVAITYCDGKRGGRILFPSCNIRYELYPFYSVNAPGGLVPETNSSQTDSRYSQDPLYLSHSCSSDGTRKFDDDFRRNLATLLSSLSSNATGLDSNGFGEVADRVYGRFMCRGDLPPRLCQQCVLDARYRITTECPSSVEAIVWYSHCLLRYSHQRFTSKMRTSPSFNRLNVTNVNVMESSFKSQLANALTEVANKTGDRAERYRKESLKLNDNQTLYILAQCTGDLSSDDCGGCLNDVIQSTIPWNRLGSVGGRVLYPSCTMRFELFQFYRDGTEDQGPPPSEKKDRSQAIIWIVVSIIVSVILLSSCYYLMRRKAKKSYRHILKENFGHESTTVESLQFDLAIIEAATNNFSPYNRIGKGGFGEVYKGVLHDGQHIAVKRLSRSSTQGAVEFKNEVLLIAKLQHRNLVAFIGFCLEEQEKILIYEYVPNKSLDYLLFDSHSKKLLSWSERHNIIGGIARGILYLHEYSRLKVIHRDLKPSNVLLDENMNPKISDFGLAKIVEIDQQQGSTNKIVGTWGYMSPEYAMLGQYSEKSDVFSFGVMILEIITGKKNIRSYEPHRVAEGLLSLVWRQFRDQMPLSILDSKLKEDCSTIEVIRCIQIGLLCVQEDPDDRPTMMTVVSYFSNHLMELPYPREPAFFLRHKMDPKIAVQESSSSSANELSM